MLWKERGKSYRLRSQILHAENIFDGDSGRHPGSDLQNLHAYGVSSSL